MNPRALLLCLTALGSQFSQAQDEASSAPGSKIDTGGVTDAVAENEKVTSDAKDAKEVLPAVSIDSNTSQAAPPAGSPMSVVVQVEKLRAGTAPIDPKSVKLLAPFPAKPLATVPAGWHLEPSTTAPSMTRNVELAPGAIVTLNIRPHLLVPDADGVNSFSITEPGFKAALGYHQAQTVSAVLATSIQQLDEDAKQLGNAIEQLQQLVSSLPKPVPKPQVPPVNPTQKPSNKR